MTSRSSTDEDDFYQNKLNELDRRCRQHHFTLFGPKLTGAIVLQGCNATGPWPFSMATIEHKYKLKSVFNNQEESGVGFPMYLCFYGGLEYLVDSFVEKKRLANDAQRQALYRLLDCFSEEKHEKCLRLLKETKCEEEVQEILAVHYFKPLVCEASYTIDAAHFPKQNRNCPGCGEEIILGNTSFGNLNVWHGNADIQIRRSTVKVHTDEQKSIHGDVDGNIVEDSGDNVPGIEVKDGEAQPLRKKQQNATMGSMDDYETDYDSDYISAFEVESEKRSKKMQAFSQTVAQAIVNAFYETKKNGHLSNKCIPSFLATERVIVLVMYNCDDDTLFASENLEIWDPEEPSSLNISTMISVWLALNFEFFDNELCRRELLDPQIPNSDFKKIVGPKLEFYKNITRPLENEEIGIETLEMSQISAATKSDKFERLIAKMYKKR